MLTSLFKYGTVVSVDDELDGDRIKVHVRGSDPANFKLRDIPFAFPLLPKNLYVKPKVGESVFVFTQDGSLDGDRFWVGPIISQSHRLDFDGKTSKSFLSSGLIKPDIAPSTDADNVGVQLENDDIGLQGRGSTDVILKQDEVRIRAGKSIDMRKLNKENPSYIQIKHNKSNKQGAINIVSDYVNILSHKSIDKFNLTDPNHMITEDELNKIMEEAHQLPFGDKLVELLIIMIKAFTTHVHAYPGLPPDLNQIEVKNLIEYPIDNILSKNIRIN